MSSLDGFVNHSILESREGKRARACFAAETAFADRGYSIEPTVFAGVHHGMKIAPEEIFGAVMTIIPFASLEEALEPANQTTYGLMAAVWTRDTRKALTVANTSENMGCCNIRG